MLHKCRVKVISFLHGMLASELGKGYGYWANTFKTDFAATKAGWCFHDRVRHPITWLKVKWIFRKGRRHG